MVAISADTVYVAHFDAARSNRTVHMYGAAVGGGGFGAPLECSVAFECCAGLSAGRAALGVDVDAPDTLGPAEDGGARRLSLRVCTGLACDASGDARGCREASKRSRRAQRRLDDAERRALREEVRGLIVHVHDSYMLHAFPLDELRPLSCGGADFEPAAGSMLTLVDSLDTLALVGNASAFHAGVRAVVAELDVGPAYRLDANVSVFETTIRVLGGLLSAHILLVDPAYALGMQGYSGELLVHARDLAARLLPAFDTITGIPYGTVNLAKGARALVWVAGVPTRMSRRPRWRVDRRVPGRCGFPRARVPGAILPLRGGSVWARCAAGRAGHVRSRVEPRARGQAHRRGDGVVDGADVGGGLQLGLRVRVPREGVRGTGICIRVLYWQMHSRMARRYELFGDAGAWHLFCRAYGGVRRHCRRGPWFADVNMGTGHADTSTVDSLGAFVPGMQISAGDLAEASWNLNAHHKVCTRACGFSAVLTWHARAQIWDDYDYIPEQFVWTDWTLPAAAGARMYPLRPELAEAT